MPDIRVSYKDEPSQVLMVRLIATWARGDIDAPIMSASSGPKSYVKNLVFALFDDNPAIDNVCMVRGYGSPFFLLRIGGKYFDMVNRELELSEELCTSPVSG